MLTFYLVRHGNTENNRKGKIMGGQIDTPLTDEGFKNAEILTQKLQSISFDHVYSSDLGRAFITAFILGENLKLLPHISREKLLREIDFGIYTNRKKEEVLLECPEYKTSSNFVFPEGESYEDVQKRAITFLHHLEKKHSGQTILVVTHAGVIRAIKCFLNHWDLNSHLQMHITHEYIGKFIIENGSLISYEKINQ